MSAAVLPLPAATRTGRLRAAVVSVVLLCASLLAVSFTVAGGARADTKPLDGTPATVSADALPTWQVNGVVYAQVTVGNTVYATGKFTYARPPGTADGVSSQVARSNLLAYDITTGNLITSFNHSLNGVGRGISASPDGSRVYVVGDFTTVDGAVHARIAAFDTSSGTLVTGFTAAVNATARSVTATNSTVYVGGDFTTANGSTASKLAAFSASAGSLLSWPAAANDSVTALVLSPDLSRVVIAGRFTQLDNVSYYGIGAVSASTGAASSWVSNFPIRDAGANASITDLVADGTYVYGTAYDFGSGGNFEGRFAVNPATGAVAWLDSCHGDSYSLAVVGKVVYSASHAHDCSDTSSFDQMTNFARAQAETNYATGIAAHNNDTGNANYHDFGGQPANTILPWAPTLAAGTFTGQDQAAWSVTANSSYVAYGGEFPTVNGTAQQGLVRFAVTSIAPNKVKPVSKTAQTPQAASTIAGTVRVRWTGTYDPDNANLTYALYRDGGSTPIYTTQAVSTFYQSPELSYTDVGLQPGSTHSYTVRISDPFGNYFPTYASNTVTVASSGTRSTYEAGVLGDGASSFWPLSDKTGTVVADHVGGNDLSLVATSDVTHGVAGPPAAGGSTATTFDGTSAGSAAGIVGAVPTQDVSVEAWVKTTSAGGQIVDYGLSNTRPSAISSDSLYLDNSGVPHFTVWTNTGYVSVAATSSTVVDDGKWHYLTATLSHTAGTTLYVDGVKVGANAALTTARQILGYWRVAGDSVAYQPSAPTNPFFGGTIADVGVYPVALSAAQAAAHFAGTGYTNQSPTASFTSSCTALTCSWNAAASADSDGTIASYSWNYGDGTGGSGVQPSHTYSGPGTYTVTVTVADNDGALAKYSRSVTVAPNQAPTASFTSTCTALSCSVDASASSDPDGSIVNYSWNFGDGSTLVGGRTQTHAYPSAGDYPVTLTVTDNGNPGLSGSSTSTLVPRPAANPSAALAADAFGRTVSGGFGTADLGGAWVATSSASTLAVNQGSATMADTAAPSSSGAALTSVSSTDSDTTATVTMDKAPTGSGTYVYVIGRRINASNLYRGRIKLAPGGKVYAALTMLNASSTETVLAPDTLVGGLTFTPGTALKADLQVVGTNPTTLGLNVWPATSAEPSGWQVSTTDSTAGLQKAGAVGLGSFTFSNATNTPQTVSVTSFAANRTHLAPSAAATASCNQLSCSFDGSGSTGSGALTYAWSFGDGTQSAAASPSHTYTAGGTYRATLTVTDSSNYTSVATTTVTLNQPPVAAFTPTCSKLACTFDATASSDPDGSVQSASWDFGDGSTATGLTTSHTFASANTYPVVLTVTDNSGGTGSTSIQLVVPAPDVPPVAAFTGTCTTATCTFDASSSSDSDGSVTGYSWNFADGTSATGTNVSHTYAVAGDYPVTLTVTDNDGGTDSDTRTFTTVPPSNNTQLASDTFGRTVSNGFGTADLGGDWTATNATTDLSVGGGAGQLNMGSAGKAVGAVLNSVRSTDSDVTATVSLNKLATGSGTYINVTGRRIAANKEYRARVKVLKGSQLLLSIQAYNGSATATTVVADTQIPLQYTAGLQLAMDFVVTGTNPTRLAFTVWKAGTVQPSSPQVSGTDGSSALQTAGSPGLLTNLTSDSTNAPVVASVLAFADTRAQKPPAASITANCQNQGTGVPCAFDASGTSDAQGGLSYAWSFGDGSTLTGSSSTASHAFAVPGTYRVTMTATDSAGLTGVARYTVNVFDPPSASFTGTCTSASTCSFDGTASSSPSGDISDYSWDFGDGASGSGPTVSHTFPTNGTFSVTLTVTDENGVTAGSTTSYSFGSGNQSPTSAFVVTCQALACTFDGSTSSDPDGSVVSWAWDYGDNTTGTGKTSTHTYAAASRVVVTLTVTDDDGATGTSTYVVQTRAGNASPKASFTTTCSSGYVCSFDGSSSTDPDGSVVSWSWSFGDGTTATGQTVQHTFADATQRTVQLTVTDNDGATDSTTQSVTPSQTRAMAMPRQAAATTRPLTGGTFAAHGR